MAYECFVAICNPLLYTVVMSQRLCAMLVVVSYAWGVACSLTLTCSAVKLSFRGFDTITSVSFLPCSSSLILILLSASRCFSLLLPLMRWSRCSSFSRPACSLLSPPEDAVSWWLSQSLLHPRLPPDRHLHLPRRHPLPLLCAQLHTLQAHSQSGVCVLHGGHPHVESPDLQSEK